MLCSGAFLNTFCTRKPCRNGSGDSGSCARHPRVTQGSLKGHRSEWKGLCRHLCFVTCLTCASIQTCDMSHLCFDSDLHTSLVVGFIRNVCYASSHVSLVLRFRPVTSHVSLVLRFRPVTKHTCQLRPRFRPVTKQALNL